MTELKTRPNDSRVEDFLNSIEDDVKRQDSFTLVKLLEEVTGYQPKMWSGGIVGFGDRHYVYETGREGDWFQVGFSPRKQKLTVYMTYEAINQHDLLEKLGKHKTGKACLYINKLADIDLPTLRQLLERTIKS